MKRLLAAICLSLAFASLSFAAEIRPFVRGSFAAIKQEHAGRPLLIHFWSAACEPCLAELPRLAALREKHPEVDFVLVSTDGNRDRSRVERRLQSAGMAGALNFAFDDDYVDRLRFEADPSWQGELPFTVLVNRRNGARSIMGPIAEDDFNGWLRD